LKKVYIMMRGQKNIQLWQQFEFNLQRP